MNPVVPAVEPVTDEALNQVPLLTNYNLFLTDATLVNAVERAGAGWAREQLSELGRLLGTEEVQRWDSTPMRTRRCCIRMTASATGATRWYFIPPGTM